jgi:hypothetical protein
MQSRARRTLQRVSTAILVVVAIPLSIHAQQSIEELGRFSTGRPLRAVAVQDGIAYLGGETSLVVLDVSNPAAPQVLGELDLRGGGPVEDLALSGTHVYIAAGELSVIDAGDSANPRLIATVGETWSATGLAIVDKIAYVADGSGEGGLRVLDVSNPAHPVELGVYEMLQAASDVSVKDGIAYVVDDDGLQTVNISSPAQPVQSGALAIEICTTNVHVDGTVAYVGGSCTGGRLWMVDVRDPDRPTVQSSYGTPSCVAGIAVDESVAYLSDGCRGGVWVIEVSDPADPQELVFYETSGPAPDITAAEGMVYVVDNAGNLTMLRLTRPARQQRMPEAGRDSRGMLSARALSLIGGLLVLLGCGLNAYETKRASHCGVTRSRENGRLGESNGH